MKSKNIVIILLFLAIIVGVIIYTTLINKKNGQVIELTYAEYNEKINNNESFVLFMWQTGCSHCETFEPKLKKAVSEKGLEIYSINLENLNETEYAKLKNKTFVNGTPTTIYIEKGVTQTTKLIGDKDTKAIIDFFKNYDLIK